MKTSFLVLLIPTSIKLNPDFISPNIIFMPDTKACLFVFISALKADRRRLKAEKFDLLNQMKQLYLTLEDKEKELRDFIRSYGQVSCKDI